MATHGGKPAGGDMRNAEPPISRTVRALRFDRVARGLGFVQTFRRRCGRRGLTGMPAALRGTIWQGCASDR